MAFNDSYITNVGQDLLTAAASGEKITWIRAATSSWDVDNKSASEMKALTSIIESDSQYTGDGDVSSFIYMDGNPKTASINCQIDNATYENGGPANLFGVWAKTSVTYQEEKLVFVARRGGGAQTSISPKSVDPEFKLFVKFGIRLDSFDNAPEVTLTVADDVYATAEELDDEITAREDFDARSVTTHSAASALAGDPQDIYGEKTFKNDTKHSGNVLPTDGGTYNLGSGTAGWDSVYANYFSGNAETATALETARRIDGVSFDGSSNITHYGECTTPAATAVKDVSIPGLSLQQGAVVIIKFAETNTATNPQLRVNGGTAHWMYLRRVDEGSSSSIYDQVGTNEATSWSAGETVSFVYDDTPGSGSTGRWYTISKPRTTRYSYISTAAISDSSKHPLVFTDPTSDSAGIISSGVKSLATSTVDDYLYYKPSSLTLYCPTFSGSLDGSARSLYAKTQVSSSYYYNKFEITNVTGTTTLLWSSDAAIVPNSDYGYSLGYYSSTSGRSRRWNYLYTKYVGGSSSYVSNAYITNISTSKISDATNRHDILNISCTYTSSSSTYASVISPCDNVFTYSTRTCDLGTVQNAFSNVFTKKVSFAYYAATNGTYGSYSLYSGTYGIHCDGRLCPNSDGNVSLGHSQCKWNYIYARYIGSSNYPTNYGYFANLYLPSGSSSNYVSLPNYLSGSYNSNGEATPGSTTNIGSIRLLYVEVPANTTANTGWIEAGSTVTNGYIGGKSFNTGIAYLQSSPGNDVHVGVDYSSISGTWKMLSTVYISTQTSTVYVPFLAIRIS